MTPRTTQLGSKKIGLVGGLAVRAGIFYYDELAKHYAAMNRPLPLMLNHADVNTVLAFVRDGDRNAFGEYLGALANELLAGGADLVAITAVAPHMAADEIANSARGPIVNVLDLILPTLRARSINRVAVFGNRAVMESNVFGSIPRHMIIAPSPAIIDAVHAAYSDIALNGKRGTHREVQFLDSLARELIEDRGALAQTPNAHFDVESSAGDGLLRGTLPIGLAFASNGDIYDLRRPARRDHFRRRPLRTTERRRRHVNGALRGRFGRRCAGAI